MPSVPFPGFIGPSYRFEDSRWAACERTVNWMLLANESQTEAKWRFSLMRSPGNAAFGELPVPALFAKPNRGLIENRGKVYGVNGNVCFEINSAGVYRFLGNVASYTSDNPLYTQPCSMTANGNGQIFFVSKNQGYIIEGGVLTDAPIDFQGGNVVTFQDGYIIATQGDTNVFQISGTDDQPLGNAKVWSPANVGVLAGQADFIKACISRKEYLRFLGQKRSEVWQNVGNNGIGQFPFANYNQTFIETGIGAVYSLAASVDALMWVSEDENGFRTCWRDAGFNPIRASNFAVEQAWASYSSVSDAVAFFYKWQGHLIYRITFPHAFESGTRFPLGAHSGDLTSATWEYDETMSQLLGRPIWNERSYQTAYGVSQGRSELHHCVGFGKHLVGSVGTDGNPGAVYEMSNAAYTDCGTDIDGAQSQQAIVRDRICPHIYDRNVRIIYDRLSLDCSRGVGLDGDPTAWGADPQMYLRWSNNASLTFGPEYNMSVGKIGEYDKLVFMDRMGYGRQRVYWLRYSDPTDMALVNAALWIRPCNS